MERIPCPYCETRPKMTKKPLCYQCYFNPFIRALYPPTSKFAQKGVARKAPAPNATNEPTQARRGSLEKVEVLARRAELGQPLWHDDDA